MSRARSSNLLVGITVLFVVLVGSVSAWGEVIYVDGDASPGGDGSSWGTAYKYLQDALNKPPTGGDEIWVAAGTYKPDEDEGDNVAPKDRTETFQLINGVTIKGGYPGYGAGDPNERDVELYETILSGDLNMPGDKSDNSYHVVTADDPEIGQSTVLDGFTVRGGNANGLWEEGYGDGGGIFCYGSGPTIRNCVICENSVGYLGHGGGMSNELGNPAVVKCTFRGNLADRYGGGMLNYLGSATLVDCRFVGNSTRSGGGGMFNWSSDVSLTDCVFAGNSATDDAGGGMHNYDSDVTLSGCVFSGNSSRRNGGGMYVYDKTTRLTRCTLSSNSAGLKGGGIYNYEGDVELTNCIVWVNSDSEVEGTAAVSYSDIGGGRPGEGNLDVDPCFADPGYWDTNGTLEDANDDFWVDGDYHLKSEGGRWDANERRWTRDDVTSQCIDAGNPMSPIGLEPFPNGGIINMGAYGGTPKASKSYFGEPLCETIIAGDINGDCVIDFGDFCIMALHWCEDNNP